MRADLSTSNCEGLIYMCSSIQKLRNSVLFICPPVTEQCTVPVWAQGPFTIIRATEPEVPYTLQEHKERSVWPGRVGSRGPEIEVFRGTSWLSPEREVHLAGK